MSGMRPGAGGCFVALDCAFLGARISNSKHHFKFSDQLLALYLTSGSVW